MIWIFRTCAYNLREALHFLAELETGKSLYTQEMTELEAESDLVLWEN